MNARKFLNVRVSLTVTALALCGAVGMSSMTTSCASSSSSGGSAGSSNGGSTSNGGTSGGNGGAAGSGSGTCSDPANDAVNFCNGKAQGVLTGYAYIALGSQDTALDPKCATDPKNPTTTQQITNATPCPSTGTTVWNTTSALCITGTIPAVTTPSGSTSPDYTSDWGLQIGMNTVDPPATSAGSGTLGKTYTHMTYTTTGSITPTNQAIRAIIHLVSMGTTDNPYCATMSASGKAMTLTSFNTACWDGTGTALKATDIPNIDKIGIQISSDVTNSYTVSNYCLTGVQFDNN